MHLSATWWFWPFERSWTNVSQGAYDLRYSGDYCWCLFVFGLLRPDLPPWGYKNSKMCHLTDSKDTELGSCDQEASILAGKKQYQASFSAMSHMGLCPYSYFLWCGYFHGSWVSFVITDEFLVWVTKITSRIGVSWAHSLPFWHWPIFKSMKWPYYLKYVNQITVSRTTL